MQLNSDEIIQQLAVLLGWADKMDSYKLADLAINPIPDAGNKVLNDLAHVIHSQSLRLKQSEHMLQCFSAITENIELFNTDTANHNGVEFVIELIAKQLRVSDYCVLIKDATQYQPLALSFADYLSTPLSTALVEQLLQAEDSGVAMFNDVMSAPEGKGQGKGQGKELSSGAQLYGQYGDEVIGSHFIFAQIGHWSEVLLFHRTLGSPPFAAHEVDLVKSLCAHIALILRNNRLTQEAIQTQQELERLNTTIEAEKNAALGRLVAGVAHEVNTPIGITVTVSSFIGDMTHKLLEAVADKQLTVKKLDQYLGQMSESINIILTSTNRAAEIISNFKQVAVDQTSFNDQVINLGRYVSRIIESLNSQIEQYPVKVINKCPDNISFMTLPGAITLVLTNLVMNSLTHAYQDEEQGEIVIDAEEHEEFVRIYYRDDGQGISGEHLARIYEPFYTTKRNKGATGLGLHIVYNLVTNGLKGKLSCHSEPGQGVEFVMEIPKD